MKQKQALNEKDNHQADDEEKRNDRIKETLIKLKAWLEIADEDEELFNQQYNNFKVIIEELDKKALEEFWICLDHNRAEVKRKRMQRMKEEENSQEADKIPKEMKWLYGLSQTKDNQCQKTSFERLRRKAKTKA